MPGRDSRSVFNAVSLLFVRAMGPRISTHNANHIPNAGQVFDPLGSQLPEAHGAAPIPD